MTCTSSQLTFAWKLLLKLKEEQLLQEQLGKWCRLSYMCEFCIFKCDSVRLQRYINSCLFFILLTNCTTVLVEDTIINAWGHLLYNLVDELGHLNREVVFFIYYMYFSGRWSDKHVMDPDHCYGSSTWVGTILCLQSSHTTALMFSRMIW